MTTSPLKGLIFVLLIFLVQIIKAQAVDDIAAAEKPAVEQPVTVAPPEPEEHASLEQILQQDLSQKTEDVDASCVAFSGVREAVSAAKESRIKNNFFKNFSGKRIRHIEFKTLSIFDPNDPRENNRLYLLLNKLHVNTRPKVVRAQLLFKEGEPLDIKHVQESERILRKRAYLTNAYILPKTICAEDIDVLVVTQDSWALEPQISLSHKSQDTQTGFAIADGNILGSGNSLVIGYAENQARTLISYDFSNPHVFNSQISARIYYADTSDGNNTLLNIERPFHSLETPWAAGFYTEDITQLDTIRHADLQINEYNHQSMMNQVYVGFATKVTSKATQRLLFGLSNEEDNFFITEDTLQEIPKERKAVYPWIEYQYLENRFGVFKNLNQIQRPEDVALGSNFSLRLGYAGTQFDNPDDVVRYISRYSLVQDVRGKHMFETKLSLDGRYHFNLEGIGSTVAGVAVSYNYFQDEKRRWYASLSYDVGKDLAQYEELTAGDITGLRGYPSDYQRGDERYVFTLERRYFSDIHIFNLMRVGAVVFFDMGKSWGLEPYGASPLLADVGFGLRLSSTKVRIGNVVHIDVATPTTARAGISNVQLTVGAFQRF